MHPLVQTIRRCAAAAPLLLALAGCGGGGAGSDAAPAAPSAAIPAAPPVASVAAAPIANAGANAGADTGADAGAGAGAADLVTEQTQAQVSAVAPAGTASGQQRVAAATATATSSGNACAAVRPFYWEIGDRGDKLAAGSVPDASGAARYNAGTAMAIASASKWVYGAYVAQRHGTLTLADRKHLQMRSGFVGLQSCAGDRTVDDCLADAGNGAYTAAADGLFDYDGGHMEKHASLIGLGAMNNAALAAEVQSQIGSDVALAYLQPLLPGGLKMTPDAYGRFLRKMLGGQLRLGALLGDDPVCTNASVCGRDKALYTPVPAAESWHYALAHWVEDDPRNGDGAFSSGGAFGFYPWIDAGKTHYGIVARAVQDGGWASAQCGRLIRKAWSTGVAR